MTWDTPEAAEKRRKAKEAKREENRKKFQMEKRKQTDLAAKKPRSTPEGQKQVMMELRGKLLSAGNSENVLRKILEVAYNDEHPGQMQALKMCFDRMLPQSMFEDKSKMDKPMISINITGINDPVVEANTIDGEASDVSER